MKVINSNKIKNTMYVNGNKDSFYIIDPNSGQLTINFPKKPIYVTYVVTPNGSGSWNVKSNTKGNTKI
jgi:hypothetical protein